MTLLEELKTVNEATPPKQSPSRAWPYGRQRCQLPNVLHNFYPGVYAGHVSSYFLQLELRRRDISYVW